MVDFIDDILDVLGLGQEEEPEVSWETRVAEAVAAYTPPSGLKITFDFQDLSKRVNKKTSVHSFPDANGVLVQDHGVGTRIYPMRVIFWGLDCDTQAKVFDAALEETGIGTLDHPMYGDNIPVVPFGAITRRDDLVTNANQVIFDVVFYKTIEAIYPAVDEDQANAVLTALDLFGEAGAAEFATSISQGTISEEQGLIDNIQDLLGEVQDGLDSIAAVQDIVNDQFQDLVDTINLGIDTLIAQPLSLAFNIQQMVQAPGTALANINDRLAGYTNLANSIFNSSDAISDPGGPYGQGPGIETDAGSGNDLQSPNKFHVRNLYASNYVAGSILSVLYTSNDKGGATAVPAVQQQQADAAETGVSAKNKFNNSSDVLVAAESLLSQMESLQTWRDANFKSMAGDSAEFLSTPNNTDQGGSIQSLTDAVGLAAGYLIQLSFSLPKEKALVLDRDRTIVDLSYELFGSVDDQLDALIENNNLTGDEIKELPKGKTIVYYV